MGLYHNITIMQALTLWPLGKVPEILKMLFYRSCYILNSYTCPVKMLLYGYRGTLLMLSQYWFR